MNRSVAFHIYHNNLNALKNDISSLKRQNRIKNGDMDTYVKMAIDDDRSGDRIEMVGYLISQGANFMVAYDHAKTKGRTAILENLSSFLTN
jgi:hypothetical protein